MSPLRDATERLLLIDDDPKLGGMIKEYLTDHGFDITVVLTGEEGLDFHKRRPFDAVILDLMLPDIEGLEVCRQIKARSNTPILMLTAKGDPLDRVIGLELGADDYVPKPFEPRELLARIRAVLRRGRLEKHEIVSRFGRLEIDRERLEARLNGERCNLTSHQFQILDMLSQAAGRVLSRDQIMNQLGGHDAEAFDRSIDVHVSRIRSEIEEDPRHPRRVITVRGVGYVFAKAQD
ncbi:MAG: response regulator transcription factor [Pseudomonadota bacterium]